MARVFPHSAWGWLLPLLTLLMVLGVAGCGNSHPTEDLWEEYRYRLGNSLQVDSTASPGGAINPSWRYPSRRLLRMEVEPVSINMLEFLRLSACEVQRLIGERNSSLGQLAPESQRLLYEIQFLALAEDCVQALREKSDDDPGQALARRLQQAVAIKRRNLPRVTWNALAASREMVALHALSARPLSPLRAVSSPSQLLQSLDFLLFLRDSLEIGVDSTTTALPLEQHLQVLGAEPYMGSLLLSLALATENLKLMTHSLRTRLEGRPLCYRRQPSPQGRILERVFHKYYIGRVQPYLAALHQRGQSLQRRMQQLYGVEEGSTPSVLQHWWQATWAVEGQDEDPEEEFGQGSVWNQYVAALEAHTQAWQGLMGQCGLMPSA